MNVTDDQAKADAADVDALTARRTRKHNFRVATINCLGHSHTRPGGNKAGRGWLGSRARTILLSIIIRRRRLDLVGLQEFQDEQRRVLGKRLGMRWAMHHKGDNACLWRVDTWKLYAGDGGVGTFTIPYFGGNPKPMPYVVLEHLASGQYIAFASTHNPASVRGPALHWRKEGWETEAEWARTMLTNPAIVAAICVGDKNSPPKVFMPFITARGGIPSGVPDIWGIDWIVGWGRVEFVDHRTSTTPRIKRATDHPVTQAVGLI